MENWGKLSQFQKLCEFAARTGGQILVRRLGNVSAIDKTGGGPVTQADFEAQAAIRKLITENYPQHAFLGEENTGISESRTQSDYCWIVDPLDGTLNYLRQLPPFSVSVALRFRDQVIAGAIFDPVLGECFSAALGRGANLNGQPIAVSDCRAVAKSLLVCSLPMRVTRTSPEITRLLNVVCDGGATFRRLGSAALNLCYVACGRLDGYWATSVEIWDVAAGALIVVEAGGQIRHINGSEFDASDPKLVVASTPELLQQLLPLLAVD
jgi:myo-inositol-1(or 4)-monophosphatase